MATRPTGMNRGGWRALSNARVAVLVLHPLHRDDLSRGALCISLRSEAAVAEMTVPKVLEWLYKNAEQLMSSTHYEDSKPATFCHVDSVLLHGTRVHADGTRDEGCFQLSVNDDNDSPTFELLQGVRTYADGTVHKGKWDVVMATCDGGDEAYIGTTTDPHGVTMGWEYGNEFANDDEKFQECSDAAQDAEQLVAKILRDHETERKVEAACEVACEVARRDAVEAHLLQEARLEDDVENADPNTPNTRKRTQLEAEEARKRQRLEDVGGSSFGGCDVGGSSFGGCDVDDSSFGGDDGARLETEARVQAAQKSWKLVCIAVAYLSKLRRMQVMRARQEAAQKSWKHVCIAVAYLSKVRRMQVRARQEAAARRKAEEAARKKAEAAARKQAEKDAAARAGETMISKIAAGEYTTVTDSSLFPKGKRGLPSVAQAATETSVVIACTDDFWEPLGAADMDARKQQGKRLGLLVKMATGKTFPTLSFRGGRSKYTWHVLPSQDALTEAAANTSITELDQVLNTSGRMKGLRKKGMSECPTCACPLPEDDLAILRMFRGAQGQCACGRPH